MEEWKEYKLGELCNIFTGKKDVNQTTSDGLYPFFSCAPTPYKSKDYLYDGEAIIVAGNGSFTGRVSSYIGKFDLYQRTYACVPIMENFDFHYLYYYMKACFEPKFMGGTRGSSIPYIVKGDLLDFIVALPSLTSQRIIANILKSLDDKIEVNRRINDNLEQQAQALFKSWFVDFEPFKDQPFVESELGMIPQGWKVGTFLDNINVMPGGTPSTGVEEYWKDGDIPFFSPKDVNGVYCFETEKRITEEGLNNCSSHLYPKDTLFITARGTVGKLTLAGVPMAMNQSNYALVAKEGIGKYYLYLLAQTLVAVLLKKANGAVFSAITTKDFDESTIVPSQSVLERFETILTPIFDKIYETSKESRRLAELRDTLLPRLMSGELKVNDVI